MATASALQLTLNAAPEEWDDENFNPEQWITARVKGVEEYSKWVILDIELHEDVEDYSDEEEPSTYSRSTLKFEVECRNFWNSADKSSHGSTADKVRVRKTEVCIFAEDGTSETYNPDPGQTFIVMDGKRGKILLEVVFPEGFEDGIIKKIRKKYSFCASDLCRFLQLLTFEEATALRTSDF
ncbi:MAG: hypothetical protein OXR68_05295 [Alphaproteobacteria bacterium]|nr:hypothetical protein [Alphaproteobacteria bacterium]